MTRIKFINIILFVVLLLSSKLYSSELYVDPGTILIQNIPLGKLCTFKELTNIDFTIHNKDTITHTYSLSTHPPYVI